jgi:hypothetical protein
MSEWEKRFDAALRVTPDSLPEIESTVWEGILGLIAPIDAVLVNERRAKGREVLHRNDPEVYWNILYTAEGFRQMYYTASTLHSTYVARPVSAALFSGQFTSLTSHDAILGLVIAIQQRAVDHLYNLGERPIVIPTEACACDQQRGVRYTLNINESLHTYAVSCTDTGLLRLEADTYEGHWALYTLFRGNLLSPRQFLEHVC